MKLISIPLARALAFIEVGELNLRNRIFLPEFLQSLAETCRFLKSPSEPKDFNLAEGITFEDGIFDGTPIEKLSIVSQVIYLDTVSGTEESRRLLLALLEWAKTTHGLNFHLASITRWAYVSDLIVKSEFPLLGQLNEALSNVAKQVSKEVAKNLHERLVFVPSVVKISHDPSLRAGSVASFTIQPRA